MDKNDKSQTKASELGNDKGGGTSSSEIPASSSSAPNFINNGILKESKIYQLRSV